MSGEGAGDGRLIDQILDAPQIVADLAAHINNSACPECGWSIEVKWSGVSCVHCDWWWSW